MKNNVYKERQYFTDKVVFALLGTGLAGTLFGLVKYILSVNYTFGYVLLYLAIAATLVFCLWWLKQLKLKVSVNEKRVKYKLFPLHKKPRKILWDEVASCKIVKTPLSAQWHGSNIRFSGELWFSLTGRNGLSIETKDGRRYFIGCKNVDNLLNSLGELPVAK